MRIQYVKETEMISKNEKEYFHSQISNLTDLITEVKLENETVNLILKFNMSFTMIDGKVLNAITNNKSSQTCPLFKATPKLTNDIKSVVKRDVITENLSFEISPLHALIRCFECIIGRFEDKLTNLSRCLD